MRFQQAPYRIADVVALLFILHGNTSFGSLAPIIPYRSCKHYYNLNLQDAEDMPIMSIPRKRDNKCVSVDTDMEELIAAAMQ